MNENEDNEGMDNLCTSDDVEPKERLESNNSNSGENLAKQTCWFFMNRNYCRYGRNCRFSHDVNDFPRYSGKKNSDLRDKLPNTKNGSRARNVRQDGCSKSSSRGEVVQRSAERGVNSRFPNHHNTSIKNPKSTDAYDKNTSSSGVQASHDSQKPRVPFRQRNLYFYRSRPSDSAKVESPPVNICRYFSKGFCRQGESCRFLHQANDRDNASKNDSKANEEVNTSENKKSAGETFKKQQLQNRHNLPVTRRLVELQDVEQNDIQRLRDTEIQQLKKRFPAHKLIKSSPEEIFHITFCPSDPDWSFAVSSVSLEIVISKEYPREACAIKVPEADNLPPILIWHLNKSISDWIKEKHQSCISSGKVELIFRPFLRWFDRNLEKLFIVGLRKVKQDMLAKEAGIEFVPHEELPGSSSKLPMETTMADIPECDNFQKTSQESGEPENGRESTGLKNIRHEDHDDKETRSRGTAQESDVYTIPEANSNCSSASAEKENFSPDLLGVKLSPNRENEYLLTPANTKLYKLSIPKLGTEVKLLGLELRESAAAMSCTKIAATFQCSRCKTRHEIKTPPNRNNSLNCIKCHRSMQVVFQSALLHQFAAVMGYLHLVDCQAVDIPLMECNFSVDCLNCSKQISIDGIHYGQQRVTWCLFCNKKLAIYTQSVKFHQLQPASTGSTGHKVTTTIKKEKKVVKDPAIQEGKPLPDCGACKHYKKSYRWLRFPCCGKTYPCDVCHDEKESGHEMKFANRMICGFCAKEQPYAGDKPCISCSSNMTKKAGAHWEGGKGCRDKITMCREDRQKYAGMNKTISRKSQIQKR